MSRWPIFLLGALGVGVAAWGTVDRPGVENVSPSMDLGIYLKVPRGAIEVGDIVELPVPPWAREFAAKHCIDGPILKRVTWAEGGDLIVQGDHMRDRSFDSSIYGAIPEAMVMGVYVPVWTWPPEEDNRTFRRGCGGSR